MLQLFALNTQIFHKQCHECKKKKNLNLQTTKKVILSNDRTTEMTGVCMIQCRHFCSYANVELLENCGKNRINDTIPTHLALSAKPDRKMHAEER